MALVPRANLTIVFFHISCKPAAKNSLRWQYKKKYKSHSLLGWSKYTLKLNYLTQKHTLVKSMDYTNCKL